MAIMEHD